MVAHEFVPYAPKSKRCAICSESAISKIHSIEAVAHQAQVNDKCVAIVEEDLHAWKRRALRAEDCISIAINTCQDVTRLGRFSHAVDPVRWVEGLQAHLETGDGDV